jgi:uncharacterized damage-inducible protein DinB
VSVEYLATLLDYTYWHDQRILAQLRKIAVDALRAPAAISHGSAFNLIRHVLDTSWSWRLFASGGAGQHYLWEAEDVPDLAALEAFWSGEPARMARLLAGRSPADLQRQVDYGTAQGGSPRMAPIWHILLHIADHAAQHRAELLHFLEAAGQPLPEAFFMDFTRQAAAGPGA